MSIDKDLLDRLMEGRSSGVHFGKEGTLSELTKALAERALTTELEEHLGAERAEGAPEDEIVISNDPGDRREHFDPNIAVRDAFDAMERRLETHSQKMRGDIKTLSGPPQGRVIRKFDGYGFVKMNDGQEIYFAPNAVVSGDFDGLEVGDAVELTVAEGEGAMGPQASMVRPISDLQMNPDKRETI